MKRYQYRIADVDMAANTLWLLGQGEQYNEQHAIDKLGDEGWELIQISTINVRGGRLRQIAIFKREAAREEGA